MLPLWQIDNKQTRRTNMFNFICMEKHRLWERFSSDFVWGTVISESLGQLALCGEHRQTAWCVLGRGGAQVCLIRLILLDACSPPDRVTDRDREMRNSTHSSMIDQTILEHYVKERQEYKNKVLSYDSKLIFNVFWKCTFISYPGRFLKIGGPSWGLSLNQGSRPSLSATLCDNKKACNQYLLWNKEKNFQNKIIN